jgi:hypothetical protein
MEDAFDILSPVFAGLPCWVPLLFAVALWFTVLPLGNALAPNTSWNDTWRLTAGVLALGCLLSGIGGQFLKRRRRQLLAQAKSLDSLQALTWREFEEL